MSVESFIISLGTGMIAILISITAYFAKKWFEHIDEKLKEHSKDLKANSSEIVSLKQGQGYQTAHLSETIRTKTDEIKLRLNDVTRTKEEVMHLKTDLDKKMILHAEHLQDLFGKIVVLEGSVQDQNNKLITMFKALKILSEKDSLNRK